MRLSQRELAVVEAAIEVDKLNLGVKAIKNTEELSEGVAGGVTVFETAHRQRVVFVFHACVERSVERGGSTLCFRMIVAVCIVFITVVAPQVEQFDDISSKENGSDSFEPKRLELRPQMVKHRVRWR
ncbi:hypothetical protein JCM18750_38270 [Halostagnicola bangensis]